MDCFGPCPFPHLTYKTAWTRALRLVRETGWLYPKRGISFPVRFDANKLRIRKMPEIAEKAKKFLKRHKIGILGCCSLRFVSYIWTNNLPETVGWLCLRKKSGKFFNRQSAKVLTLRLMPGARYSDFGIHAIRAWAFCANAVTGLPEPLRCMNHKNPRFLFPVIENYKPDSMYSTQFKNHILNQRLCYLCDVILRLWP